MEKERKSFKGEIALLTTAVIWGSGFLMVDKALDYGFSPGFINMMRFSMGALILLIVINRNITKITKVEIKTGCIAGFWYFLGFYLQTAGLQFTGISNNAIITATNLLMVPFICWLAFRRKPAKRVFAALGLCFVGIVILTWTPQGLGFGFGDFLTLICAFGFACHIAYLGVTAEGKNPLLLTFMQLLTVGVLSAITFLLVEGGDTSGAQWNPGFLVLVYLAAFPSALCLFLQTFGQKCTPTSTSAVLLSFESLFGVVFSILFGMEDFTIKLLIGGVIVLASVIWLELKGTEETITHAVE